MPAWASKQDILELARQLLQQKFSSSQTTGLQGRPA